MRIWKKKLKRKNKSSLSSISSFLKCAPEYFPFIKIYSQKS